MKAKQDVGLDRKMLKANKNCERAETDGERTVKNENIFMENLKKTWSSDSVRLIMTPGAAAKRTFFYVQEAGYFKTTYPYFTERKNLDSFLIVFTLAGKGQLKYGGKCYTIKKHQCFFIHCINHHIYETLQGESWEFLWVHFNGGSALGYYEQFVSDGFGIVTMDLPCAVESYMRALLDTNRKRQASTELRSSQWIVGILTELLLQKSAGNMGSLQGQIPEFVKQAAKYADIHFKEHLSLDLLAGVCNVSKYYLAREFKRCIGVTVNEYIILNRLAYSKEALKYSDLSVAEIARSVGVDNISHFINLFKAREEMTPLAYRKLWRE